MEGKVALSLANWALFAACFWLLSNEAAAGLPNVGLAAWLPGFHGDRNGACSILGYNSGDQKYHTVVMNGTCSQWNCGQSRKYLTCPWGANSVASGITTESSCSTIHQAEKKDNNGQPVNIPIPATCVGEWKDQLWICINAHVVVYQAVDYHPCTESKLKPPVPGDTGNTVIALTGDCLPAAKFDRNLNKQYNSSQIDLCAQKYKMYSNNNCSGQPMREEPMWSSDWKKQILDNCNKQRQPYQKNSWCGGCAHETIQCSFECPTPSPTPSPTPPTAPPIVSGNPAPTPAAATGTFSFEMTANFGTCPNAKACVATTGANGCAGKAASVMAQQINVLVNQIACSAASPACPRRLSDVSVSERKLSGTAGDVEFSYTITAADSDINSLSTKVTNQGTTNKVAFQTAFKSALTTAGANYAGNLTVHSVVVSTGTPVTNSGTRFAHAGIIISAVVGSSFLMTTASTTAWA